MTPHRLTKATGLQMTRDGAGYWRHVDTNDPKPDGSPAYVGPLYVTQAELLADLEDYASRAGWLGDMGTEADALQQALEALRDALPYVEDVLSNPAQSGFKPGTVQQHAAAIRAAIAALSK
jgi:hypothetical protein